MEVLILGNGFDLAHKLNTRYTDFLKFCLSEENLRQLYDNGKIEFNLWFKHFLSTYIQDIDKNWIDLEDEILKVIEIISSQLKNNKGLGLFVNGISGLRFQFYLNEKFNLNNLFNNVSFFEKISKYKITKPEIDIENSTQYIYVFVENIKYLSDFLYDQLRDFTALLQKYLEIEINNKIPNTGMPKSEFKLSNIGRSMYVLNFNYTNTIERYYKIPFNTDLTAGEINITSFYVHGSLSSESEKNLILGTDSFKTESNIDINFNKFRKYNQRHKYGTINSYQDLIDKLTNTQEQQINFHIIGHSLGQSDYTIFNHLLLINHKAKIKIYYHDEESQENLINKIRDIIGEKEVMARVQFIKQDEQARGILTLNH